MTTKPAAKKVVFDERELGLGPAILAELRHVVDPVSQWSDTEQLGFSWWPGELRQKFTCTLLDRGGGDPAFLLKAETDLVRDITTSPEQLYRSLVALGLDAALSAPVSYSKEAKVRLCTSIVVDHETKALLRPLFWMATGIQVAEAHTLGGAFAKSLSGKLDVSAPPGRGQRGEPDEILQMIEQMIWPEGQGPSVWLGPSEFSYSLDCLKEEGGQAVRGDDAGFSCELPFGEADKAVIMASAASRNPRMGSGVQITTTLPTRFTEEAANDRATFCNSVEWFQGKHPLVGSWCVRRSAEFASGCFTTFIPNSLFRPGLLAHFARDAARRVRWAERIWAQDTKKMFEGTG